MAVPTAMEIRDAVALHWGIQAASSPAPDGGMNSVVVVLDGPQGRVVAKWVRAREAEQLRDGLRTALVMEAGGLRAGAPVPTRAGGSTAAFRGGELAVMREVPGAPLTADDQLLWGAALARIHLIGGGARDEPFALRGWLEEVGGADEREPWVREAVGRVLRDFDALPPLSWSLLHTDPEPGAFRRDAEGRVGVIDWAGSMRGPVLFDLASAVMYAGGRAAARPLLAAYLAAAPGLADEVRTHLGALERFRGGVQAAYFSRRVAEDDGIGTEGPAGNRHGLSAAAAMLRSLGVPAPADAS